MQGEIFSYFLLQNVHGEKENGRGDWKGAARKWERPPVCPENFLEQMLISHSAFDTYLPPDKMEQNPELNILLTIKPCARYGFKLSPGGAWTIHPQGGRYFVLLLLFIHEAPRKPAWSPYKVSVVLRHPCDR